MRSVYKFLKMISIIVGALVGMFLVFVLDDHIKSIDDTFTCVCIGIVIACSVSTLSLSIWEDTEE